MEEIIKKLLLAAQDEDTAQGLKKFGIEPDQIEGLKDLKIPATLDEALTIKAVQSDFDKKVAKAIETRENNLKEKFDFVPKEQKQKEKEDEVNTDNSVLEAINALKAELASLKQEKAQETLAQKEARLAADLKSKGIPAIYVKAFDLEKDLDEQMETVSKQFEEEFGTVVKKPGQKLPFPQRGNDKPSKEEIAAIVG